MIAGLVLAAINYENNMLFVVAFYLLGLFLVCILHTYGNLSGLTIRCGGANPVYCGERAGFEFILSREGRRQYHNINLNWPQSEYVQGSLVTGSESQVSVYVPTTRRGRLKMGRLLVQTWYPLGLFRAWTWLDFNASCLVYPKPESFDSVVQMRAYSSDSGQYLHEHGAEEFAGFKDYQPGHSMKQISWANVARGLPLMSKQYESIADLQHWVDWWDFDGEPTEVRLSRMCYLVLSAHQRQIDFGLRLPGLHIEPNSGNAHKAQVLRALALFDGSESGQ